jgi:S1-C subfamily serine protease
MRRFLLLQASSLLVAATAWSVSPATAAAQEVTITAPEQQVVNVAREVSPAVVRIARRGGEGSGVIIREDGVILTNAHVVGNARTVEVVLGDGRTLTGEVLGGDPSIDIAVVRVQETGLPAAGLGDSDRLEVGQTAIAIGNPFGLDRTLTTGVISAVNRSPRGLELEGLIQTDAAINPGNSGGPLLDSSGRVVGVNTAVLRPRGVGAEGLGFAVPINLAADVADQLLTTGRVVRAFVGIGYDDVTPPLARQFQLPVEQGIIILQVQPGSPADAAGLQPRDIITRIEGTAVTHGGEFRRVLRQHRPGESIRLQVNRMGTEMEVTIDLGAARVT